jgi:hypothetical protein
MSDPVTSSALTLVHLHSWNLERGEGAICGQSGPTTKIRRDVTCDRCLAKIDLVTRLVQEMEAKRQETRRTGDPFYDED